MLGEAKLSPILFCTGAINWILDEVKSNKCFIILKNIGSNKLFGSCLEDACVYQSNSNCNLKQTVKSNLFHSSCLQLNKVCYLVSSLEVVWKMLACVYQSNCNLKQTVKSNLFHSSCLQLNKVCYLVSSLEVVWEMLACVFRNCNLKQTVKTNCFIGAK